MPGDGGEGIARTNVRNAGCGAQSIGFRQDEAAVIEGLVANSFRVPEHIVAETLDALRQFRDIASGEHFG